MKRSELISRFLIVAGIFLAVGAPLSLWARTPMLFDLKLVFSEIDLGNAVAATVAVEIVLMQLRRFTNKILTFDSDIYRKDIIILCNHKWI